VGDAELVDVDRDRGRLARLSNARAVEIEALGVRACVLVVGADDVAPAPVPEGPRDVVLQPSVGPVEISGEAAAVVVEDVAAVLAADHGPAGPAEGVHPGLDGDPIGVLDRGVVGDDQPRAVVEEDHLPPQRVLSSTVAPAMS
jgi:hypothetical protein